MTYTSLTIGFSAWLLSTFALAEPPHSDLPKETLQTGRYTQVINAPLQAQADPLKVVIDTKIPKSVRTVEEAVFFLLTRSGFRLADRSVMTHETQTLMGLTLPDVHRNIGPITLDVALSLLAGDAFELVVDPINRHVSFVADRILIGG